jgi:hypothetical protein
MDPRYNSPSGKADPKMVIDGAATVARVMRKAEARATDGDRLGEPPGVRFRIGDDVAKKINHDAPPK